MSLEPVVECHRRPPEGSRERCQFDEDEHKGAAEILKQRTLLWDLSLEGVNYRLLRESESRVNSDARVSMTFEMVGKEEIQEKRKWSVGHPQYPEP